MVKRYGRLWDKIISLENLEVAYHLARQGKKRKPAVRKFARDEQGNLLKIRNKLINKTFHTGQYTLKTIYEPKKRTIYILPFNPDRIIQHALMRVVSPIWDKIFIYDSYACRAGKGMHKGSKKTMYYIRHNKYCLKCDISKFYPSINHSILKKIIRRKVKDPNVLWLFDDIIDSYRGETNTPIGNYTSQWFGNLYMNELDMYVKHCLKFKNYIRYCDDFLFFSNDKKELHNVAEKIKEFAFNALRLNLSKCDLFPVARGVDFLGYRHFPKYILLRKSTAKKAKRKIKIALNRILKHKLTLKQFESTLASYKGWMMWAKTHNLQNSLKIDFYLERVRRSKDAAEFARTL